MNIQELEIMIDPEGKVHVRVKGVKGPQCIDLTKAMEEALGVLEDRSYTEEYYESPVNLFQEDGLKLT